MIVDILTDLLGNLEKLNHLIDTKVIDGNMYCLYSFVETREVIDDLVEDLKEGIIVANNQ